MNFHNSTQVYTRSGVKVGGRQPVRLGDLLDMTRDLVAWKAVGKILLFVLPVVLVINMLLASAVADLDRSLLAAGDVRHALMDQNIGMLAKKAQLSAPASIEKMAGEKLSLYTASKYQVGVFNRRTGTFNYL